MALPEYYPTRCETGILLKDRQGILEAMNAGRTDGTEPFQVVDLGAGNGAKTRILLDYLHPLGAVSAYVPIDISGSALDGLADKMRADLPGLRVEPIVGEYFQALETMRTLSPGRKLILFLGSTIGNFDRREANDFLRRLRQVLNPRDGLLIGFDLRKEPGRILRAYDDSLGVTSRFNLNILERINRELGGEFPLIQFQHHAVYDPEAGVARSYLVSCRDQTIRIRQAGRSFSFQAWEAIHTENSYKFSPGETSEMAQESGFRELALFWDTEGYFQDSFWRPTP